MPGLLAVLTLCCANAPRRIKSIDRYMASAAPGEFIYEDDFLKVTLQTGPGSQFRWTFKNKSRVYLTIHHRDLTLRRRGDGRRYALWGEAYPSQESLQDIEVRPGGFISFAYPIRFTSPFFQLKVEKPGDVWLELPIQWPRQVHVYRLAILPVGR